MSKLSKLNKNFVYLANKLTSKYESVFYMPCDIYFPLYPDNPDDNGTYYAANINEPHQDPSYSDTPDIVDAKFYIVNLYKNESMNSTENDFDTLYDMGEGNQPFIETSKKRELPIGSKVIVKLEGSFVRFKIDKKTAVQGADGFMLLRQYLIPLESN